jgi:hypothetical protein
MYFSRAGPPCQYRHDHTYTVEKESELTRNANGVDIAFDQFAFCAETVGPSTTGSFPVSGLVQKVDTSLDLGRDGLRVIFVVENSHDY